MADVTGDGHQDLFLFGTDRIALHDESARLVQEFAVPANALRTQLAMLAPARGAHLLTLRAGEPPLLWAPGPARGPFVALAFTGRSDPSQSMRSNESGIGTSFAVRVGSEWFGGETFRNTTGRGQSLAPVAVGVGPFAKADIVEELDRLRGIHDIKAEWVRGHVGHAENERCDKLAVAVIDQFR